MTSGTTKLLKEGATLVYRSNDILKELDTKVRQFSARNIIFENENEKIIYGLLTKESLGIDELSKIVKTDIAGLSTILSMMEIKGFIKKLNDGGYSIA